MFSNITNHDLKRIKKALPDFKKIIDYDELFIEKQIYQIRAISVFDHWLTAEEADKEIFIDDNEKELLNRRNKFKNFIETLSTKTDLYTWKYKKHNRLHIQKPSNTKDVLRKCDFENLYSLNGKRYNFLIPEFSAIYEEGWDWTNIIRYKDEEKIKPILDMAKTCGLNILNNCTYK